MNASSTEALPRVFPTVVHMLADACARFPDATALVCGRAQSLLHRVFALRRRICRRIDPAWRARLTRCPRVPKFARHADRHVWRPCRRCAGGARSIRPIPSASSATFSTMPIRSRSSTTRISPAKSSRCSRQSAYATRCGSAARPAAASMPGGTKPIGNCRSRGPLPMILRPCNIPAAPPAGPKASISATGRWP